MKLLRRQLVGMEGTLMTLKETGYSHREKDLAACIGCAVGWGEALTLLKMYLEHGIVCKEDLGFSGGKNEVNTY